MNQLKFIILFTGLTHLSFAISAELRCNELGASCVCSEPLQMTGFTANNNVFWNPNDSTDGKQCNGEGDGIGVGYTITRNASPIDLFAESNATVLSRLPANHSIQRYLRAPNGHQGTWFTGYTFPNSTQFAARVSMRFYTYQSDDFTLVNQDNPTLGCNGKFTQFDNDFKIDQGYGDGNMYNWYEIGNVARDCCFSGPSPSGGQYPANGGNPVNPNWAGKWHRIEIITTNRDATASNGKHWRMQVYRKNITDNTPEVLWFDTDQPNTQANPGLTAIKPKYGITSAFNKFLVNFYRQENVSGQCKGFRALSHLMYAGWNTDNGQRIGAAIEIEGALGGGGGSSSKPRTPANLRVK